MCAQNGIVMYYIIMLISFFNLSNADQDKPTLFDNAIPTSILILIGVVPAVVILIVAVTIVTIIGVVYREKHRNHKLQYKTQVSDNEHKEQEQQNELNHKENEHQQELNKEVQILERNLQHNEAIHQQELDHAYKLECLKTFKDILGDLIDHLRANNTTENLRELMIFLNDNVIPLLNLSKRRRGQLHNNPPIAQHGNAGDEMIDSVEETDFGGVPSLNGTATNVALDADELEVMELLCNFIKSAQLSLQQQHISIPM